jgi:hypothetical protein
MVRASADQPVDDALVEVLQLDRKGSPAETSNDALGRRRLASCLTERNGEFGFDLPPGRYELLCSKPNWNSTSVIVVVSPRGSRRKVVVPLKIGD